MYKNKNKSKKSLFKKPYGKTLNKGQKKEVVKIVNNRIETKAVDFVSAIGSTFGIAGTFTDVTSIGQGATSLTRVGDQISPVRLLLRAYFSAQITTTESLCRMIVFQWRPDNATPPTLADLFDAGPSAIVSPFTQFNYDNRHLYKIIRDWSWVMNGELENVNNLKLIVADIPLNKCSRVNYDIGVSTGDHHIYTLVIGSHTAGATAPLVTYDTRILYKDG